MFLKEYLIDTWHMRRSKLGKQHTYNRKKTMVLLRCDNCNEEFARERGSMDPKDSATTISMYAKTAMQNVLHNSVE